MREVEGYNRPEALCIVYFYPNKTRRPISYPR